MQWLADGATHARDTAKAPPISSSGAGDDYLIALAAERNAALVSGDRHLLDLKGRIPVYSPRDFLGLLERS